MTDLPLTGTVVNSIAIIVGAMTGTYLVRRVTPSLQKTVIDAISLAVLLIGLRAAWAAEDLVLLIISLATGALLGETLELDERLNRFAAGLEKRFSVGETGTFAKGFVTATLVYCVGAMAIMGSLENGITGRYDTLLAKASLDGISAVIFSSALGIGVAFSAGPVMIYQGTIALLAASLQPYLTGFVVTQMSAAGGLLILAIGLNMIGSARMKVANLLPAIPVAAALALIRELL